MSLSVQNNNYNSYLISGNNTHTATDNNENNNQINGNDRKLQEVWSSYSFEKTKIKVEQLKYDTISWANNSDTFKPEAEPHEEKLEPEIAEVNMEEPEVKVVDGAEDKEDSPSHHARRPMNAFLIFCKKHRPIVRQKFPNLENRGVTKILGEWWALLENSDKQPYTDLAKEYKDAFLSANPDFKWYKLPAPPLRTLSTRPVAPSKTPIPQTSPSTVDNNPVLSPTFTAEFTPGKLADESQLGGLTSLMNTNFTTSCFKVGENNNNEPEGYTTPPDTSIQLDSPPKPPKKRFVSETAPSVGFKRNLMDGEDLDGLTNQDLLNKVVDNCFTKSDDDYEGLNGVRKSDRSCKGKRYEQFMVENKLLGNKKDTKLTQQKFKLETKSDYDLAPAKNENETPKLALSDTIKRLAERTNTKLPEEPAENARNRSVSETSDCEKTPTNDFQLDLRISNLPSLSYEMFVMKKRESKKRKSRLKTDTAPKVQKVQEQPIGSKKRKNKSSITHLNKVEAEPAAHDNSELLRDLATLAEVAANTEKMQQ